MLIARIIDEESDPATAGGQPEWGVPMNGVGIDGVPEDMLVSDGKDEKDAPSPRNPVHTASPLRITVARTTSVSSTNLSGLGSPMTPSFMVSPGMTMGKSSQVLVEAKWEGKMRTLRSDWFEAGCAWVQAELVGVTEIGGVEHAQLAPMGCAASGFEYVPLSMVRIPLARGDSPQKVGDEAEGAQEVGGSLLWYCGVVTGVYEDTIELCIAGNSGGEGAEKVWMTFPKKTPSSRLRISPDFSAITKEEAMSLLELEPHSAAATHLDTASSHEMPPDNGTRRRKSTVSVEPSNQDELSRFLYADDEWSHSWGAQCKEGEIFARWGIKGELRALSELLCIREAYELSEYARKGANFERDFSQFCSTAIDGSSIGWERCSVADADEFVEVCMERLESSDMDMRSKASRVLLIAAIGLPGCNFRASRQIRKRLGCAASYYAILQALATSTAHHDWVDENEGGKEEGAEQDGDGEDEELCGDDEDYTEWASAVEEDEQARMRRREISAHANLIFVTVGLVKTELVGHSIQDAVDGDSGQMHEIARIILTRMDGGAATLPEMLVDLLARAGHGNGRYPVPYKKLVCLLHRCLLLALPPPSHNPSDPDETFTTETHGGKCNVEDIRNHNQRLTSMYENKVPVCLRVGNDIMRSKLHVWSGLPKLIASGGTNKLHSPDMFSLDDMVGPESGPADQLYEMLLVRLPTLVVSLLKLLLAAGVNAKENTSPPVHDLYFDADFEGEFLHGNEAVVSWERHRKIITGHAPGCLLLLMKRWRHSHFLQAEYLGRLVSDSNYLLLALKYLNQDNDSLQSSSPGVAEMDSIILSCIEARARRMVELPWTATDMADESNQSTRDQLNFETGPNSEQPLGGRWKCSQRCIRTFHSIAAVLRLLQRVVKYAPARTRTLVALKAPLILRKPVTLPSALIEKYVLKLFKVVSIILLRNLTFSQADSFA